MRRKGISAIDLHAGTSVLGWMSVKGEELGKVRFATSAENLRGWVKDIKAREVHLTIEAGPLTRWASKVLEPEVAKLVLCDPHYNKLVSKSANKCDEMDVSALCELMRLDALHPVWMGPDEDRDVFRAAVYHLLKFRDQQRELKSLIKSRYQEQGMAQTLFVFPFLEELLRLPVVPLRLVAGPQESPPAAASSPGPIASLVFVFIFMIFPFLFLHGLMVPSSPPSTRIVALCPPLLMSAANALPFFAVRFQPRSFFNLFRPVQGVPFAALGTPTANDQIKEDCDDNQRDDNDRTKTLLDQ